METCAMYEHALATAAVLGFVVHTYSASSSTQTAPSSQSSSWAVAADSQLDALKAEYSLWVENNDLIIKHGLQAKSMEQLYEANDEMAVSWFGSRTFAERMVRFHLWQLWRLTGHCAFANIPPRDLLQKTKVIMERYREFLKAKGEVRTPDILREEIAPNIDALAGDYWWYALDVLMDTIAFEGPFVLSIHGISPEGHPVMSEKDRQEIRRIMRDWYKSNKNRLVWNEQLKRFTDSRGYGGFPMPAGVYDRVSAALSDYKERLWKMGG
jgi:hypothetical protein